MKRIERIKISEGLPESFFQISKHVYSHLPYRPGEEENSTLQLLRLKRDSHEIFLYTDHQDIRLVGIFPKEEAVAYFGYWETTNNPGLNQETLFILVQVRNMALSH